VPGFVDALGEPLLPGGREPQLQRWGLTYVVNGASGAPLYRLGPRLLGSIASNDRVHGALFLRVVGDQLLGEFRASTGQRIDAFRLTRG